MTASYLNQDTLVTHVRKSLYHLDKTDVLTVLRLVETCGTPEDYRPIGSAAIDAVTKVYGTFDTLAAAMPAAEYAELVNPNAGLEVEYAA